MLREKADRRTLLFVAMYFFALAAVWLYEPLGWGWRIACMALISYLSFTCAVITHNTIHCPIFKKKKLNRAFQIVLSLAYGHPVSAYVPGHNLSHHVHTQKPKDVMRTTKLRFRWNLLNQLLFLPMVAGAIMKNDSAYVKTMKEERPAWYRQWCIEWAAIGIVTVPLFILDWRMALMYWIVPHLYAAWGIVSINFAQHDGCDEDHPYNHSRNFTGPIANWLLFNNGYHAIHHDKPNLHWSKLPEAHEELIAPHNHPALDQENLVVYMWRAYIWPGKRVRYDGEPVELPPPVEDETWVPGAEVPAEVSMGAES